MQPLASSTTTSAEAPSFSIELDPQLMIHVISPPAFDRVVAMCAERRSGMYYEMARRTAPHKSDVFITNLRRPSQAHIDRDDAWHRRLELSSSLHDMLKGVGRWDLADLHRRLPLTILTLLYRAAFPSDVQNDEVLRTFAQNSQRRLETLVSSYLAGERTYDTRWYAQHGPTHPDYSHLRHFGWIYAQQIALVEQMLHGHPGRRLTVVDLATGHGHFLLTLGRHLVATKRASRVKLIGIDCSEHDMRFAREIATTALPEVDITWVQDDLTCPGFADRLRRYRADCVIANHILEHLPGEIQNRYLQDWVLAAHLALSISVPLAEDLTCSPSQHLQQYTAEAVEKLAHSMELRVGFALEASDLPHTHTGGLITWVRTPDMLRGGGFEGTVLTLSPQGSTIRPHPVLEDFAKPFDPAEFWKKTRKAPKIAEIQDKATFERQGQPPRQVRQLPIKMPGTAVKLPQACAQFAEAVQLIIDHNQVANPEYERSYAYLNFFRGLTLFSSYRGLSLNCHGDQLQSLQTAYAFKPDWSYIVSNTLPTIFYYYHRS